jgi:hypothetical protein
MTTQIPDSDKQEPNWHLIDRHSIAVVTLLEMTAPDMDAGETLIMFCKLVGAYAASAMEMDGKAPSAERRDGMKTATLELLGHMMDEAFLRANQVENRVQN